MATSDFGPKLLRGDSTSSEEWQQHLQAVHAQFPSATSAALALRTTQQGQSSYQFLVDSAVAAARTSGRPVDILDLACGDGYLVEECLRQLGARISSVTGVDMSETALDASRARLNAPQVRLCRGLAQSLPLTDASIDVALCHAAFMLMLPLEPVVAELARVLRPGGTFSAVVGPTSASPSSSDSPELAAQRALWTETGAALRAFWHTEYPRLETDGRVGDARAMSAEGWKELFRPELGYAGDVELQEFDILIKEDSAESIYHFFVEGSYLVALLDAEAKENLKRRLIDVIAEHQRADGTLEMAFPLRMLSVHKP